MEGSQKKRKRKMAALLLATLLLPAVALAQQSGGLFGLGEVSEEPNFAQWSEDLYEQWGFRNGGLTNLGGVLYGGIGIQNFGGMGGSLFNQGFGAAQGGLDNQGFGGIESGITNQGFGEAPVGSGLFVLLAAGAGYAAYKTKTKKNKTKKVKH